VPHVFGETLGSEFEPFGHGQVGVEGVGDLVDRDPVFDRHDRSLDDVAGAVGEDVSAEEAPIRLVGDQFDQPGGGMVD
jgi:hypothetical protein